MAKKLETRTEAVSFDSHPGHIVKRYFSLSGTSIKIIACIAMLADHIGILFFPETLLWRVIGRLSFPLFAFLIAEGSRRTGNIREYLFRLLGLAVISQVPYLLFDYATGSILDNLNIFFTLSAGLIAILLWNRLSSVRAILSIALLGTLSEFLSLDYGAYGVLTVLLSYLALNHRTWGIVSLFILPQLTTTFHFILGTLSIQAFASMSVPLVASYNGERGPKLPRLFFYAFYPTHLLVLSLLWLLVRAV